MVRAAAMRLEPLGCTAWFAVEYSTGALCSGQHREHLRKHRVGIWITKERTSAQSVWDVPRRMRNCLHLWYADTDAQLHMPRLQRGCAYAIACLRVTPRNAWACCSVAARATHAAASCSSCSSRHVLHNASRVVADTCRGRTTSCHCGATRQTVRIATQYRGRAKFRKALLLTVLAGTALCPLLQVPSTSLGQAEPESPAVPCRPRYHSTQKLPGQMQSQDDHQCGLPC
jgi:hypothetical protein